MMLKYIPNLLTLFRLALIAPFFLYLHLHEYADALYTFLLAGLTDATDGWLARHYNWQSFFGSFVDPLADKLLVMSSFISLALLGSLPWWLVSLVILRDVSIFFGILGWYWFIRRKLNFEPTLLSKLNTALQLLLVVVCLAELAYYQSPDLLFNVLIGLTAVTTVITYVDYMRIWAVKAWSPKESPL
jgi:cardiolipin synthase